MQQGPGPYSERKNNSDIDFFFFMCFFMQMNVQAPCTGRKSSNNLLKKYIYITNKFFNFQDTLPG